MSYTSAHGVAVVQGYRTSFDVRIMSGYVDVRPASSDQLSGLLHFPIPRPPTGYNNIYGVTIEFSSQSCTVNSFSVWLGNSKKLEQTDLQWTSTSSSTFTTALSVQGSSGIEVVIGVTFDDSSSNSSIKIQSVDLKYA
jgi:hypothetical protein